MQQKYTRGELFDLRIPKCSRIPDKTMSDIKHMGIHKRFRGRRGGKHILKYHQQNSIVNGLTLLNNTVDRPPLKHKSYQLPSVFLCNAQSLGNKMDEFRATLYQYDVGIAAVSETWFSHDRSTEQATCMSLMVMICFARTVTIVQEEV